jgi:hypothetical protein
MVPVAATAAVLPRFTLNAADWTASADLAPAVTAPAAVPVESLLPPAAVAGAFPPAFPRVSLPLATPAAAALEPLEEVAENLTVAPPAEYWMPGPPAAEVVCEVVPTVIGALLAEVLPQQPGLARIPLYQPTVCWAGGWLPAAAAEPVFSYVSPQLQEALPGAAAASSTLSLPDLRSLDGRPGARRGGRAANLAAPADEEYPPAVEPPHAALPAVNPQTPAPGDSRWAQLLQFPELAVEQAGGNQAAGLQPAGPAASAPRNVAPQAGPAMPASGLGPAVPGPAQPADVAGFGMPQAGPLPMEFFCQRAGMAPVRSLEWTLRPPTIYPPKLALRPIFERIEEPATPKPVRRPPAFAEIFSVREVARRRVGANRLGSAGRAIAAGLLVGIGLWFGAGSVKIGKQMVAINTSFPSMDVRGSGSGTDRMSPRAPSGFGSPGLGWSGFGSAHSLPAPQTSPGVLAQVRHAIQQRAAVELTDTFRRMEAWGASARALPAGWSRHPDGYMRVGQLALYSPSQTFADYRFEFLGEIEKKSMGWAVRARDAQNYYAMKFTVVEPGLRPVIAVVHYPVVAGRKGQQVETPLSVMVHNHEPYHVAVDVKGNRVVTSIEGQEVDSWTDDTLKVGGVGFFSDMGESARLYWIRVTKNQDWLGRVCAYLSNESGIDTAELWRGDLPGAPPPLPQPAPPAGGDATLAAAETEIFSHRGPQRARDLDYGRTELCRS